MNDDSSGERLAGPGMIVIVMTALVLGLLAVLLAVPIDRYRRRRRRAIRKARHDRVAREWRFAQSLFGARPKRLTHDGREEADTGD